MTISTDKSLQNSCSEQLFGKLTGRSASVHKKNSTVDILLGIINEHFCWKKCYDTIKVWGHSNVRHSAKRGRNFDKKSNKKWRRGRVRNQKMWCHSLKQTTFYEWRSFWMVPMMMFDFAVFFMSVFVDDVIRFLWNKWTIYVKINIYYIHKTRYLQNYSIIVCKEIKEMNE